VEPDVTGAVQATSTRIVKLTILMVILALGIVLVANALRERWVLAGLGLSGALLCAALYVLVAQMPQLGRTVGLVIAALMIGLPPGFFVFDPASNVAAMPLIAIGAVVVLSLLSPVTGLVAIGVETLALTMFAITSEHMSLQTAVAFAAVAAPAHVVGRWLSEALGRAEALRSVAQDRGTELGRALHHIERGEARQASTQARAPEPHAPLIESMPGIGLLVVSGTCDARRVAAIESELFAALHEHLLRRIVIDVSTADLEPEGIDALTQMLEVLQVMVSDVVLCGITPRVARGMVGDQERVRALKRAARFVHSLREALSHRDSPTMG
jgi:anti-anti-sigma regulatory factor